MLLKERKIKHAFDFSSQLRLVFSLNFFHFKGEFEWPLNKHLKHNIEKNFYFLLVNLGTM